MKKERILEVSFWDFKLTRVKRRIFEILWWPKRKEEFLKFFFFGDPMVIQKEFKKKTRTKIFGSSCFKIYGNTMTLTLSQNWDYFLWVFWGNPHMILKLRKSRFQFFKQFKIELKRGKYDQLKQGYTKNMLYQNWVWTKLWNILIRNVGIAWMLISKLLSITWRS